MIAAKTLMSIYATEVAASVAWHDCVATVHIPGLHEAWVSKTAEEIAHDLQAVEVLRYTRTASIIDL